MRAYTHLSHHDTTRPFRTWLLSIASNHCIDRLRKRRLIWLSLDEPLPPNPSLNSDELEPEDAVITNERGALIQRMLKELSPEYRAAGDLKSPA